MDIKSVIDTIDLIFGPIARIIGYITVICGAIFTVAYSLKKIIKRMRKKKENPHIAIEVCPGQKPKIKCK